MQKVVIIYDHPANSQLLQHYLETIPGLLVSGTFSNTTEAIAQLKGVKYDVLIAPEQVLMGFKKERIHQPLWIGIGESNAENQIQHQIFAYIDLPFSLERLFSLFQQVAAFLTSKSPGSIAKREYIFIKSEYKLIKINLADILFLSGLRDYTQIFLKGKLSPLTTLQNLKDFESKLPDNNFIRVHRSYIVSLSQVDSISRNEISIGTYTSPIGHAYRPALDEMITKNS